MERGRVKHTCMSSKIYSKFGYNIILDLYNAFIMTAISCKGCSVYKNSIYYIYIYIYIFFFFFFEGGEGVRGGS